MNKMLKKSLCFFGCLGVVAINLAGCGTSNNPNETEDGFENSMYNIADSTHYIGEWVDCGSWRVFVTYVDISPNIFSEMDVNVHCLVENISLQTLTYQAGSMYKLTNHGLGKTATSSDVDGYTVDPGTRLNTIVSFNLPSASLDDLDSMTLTCEETEISFAAKPQTTEEYNSFAGTYERYNNGSVRSIYTVYETGDNVYDVYWVCGGPKSTDFFSASYTIGTSLYERDGYQAFKYGNTFYYYAAEDHCIYGVESDGGIDLNKYWSKVNPSPADECQTEDTSGIGLENTGETAEEQPPEVEEDSSYIIFDSDSRYLDKDDLSKMDSEMLRLARNEIYARHGRMFNSEELQEYFNACSWYTGTIAADEFDESVLNEYEKANIKLIHDVEETK